MPWWVYEDRCHYKGMTYIEHLLFNLKYAWTWISLCEAREDWEFERKVNPSWRATAKAMFV